MRHRPIHSGDLVKAVMNPSHLQRNLVGMIGIIVTGRLRYGFYTVLWSDGTLHMHRARNLMVLS